MIPTVSIVFGTLNRLAFLRRAIESARRAVGSYSYELIIVDGGSADGTLEYLVEQEDVALIAQGERLGAVAAFNAGFARARGEFVAAFNDDAEYIGAPLSAAVKLLQADVSIGQIAIPFARHMSSTFEQSQTRDLKSLAPTVAVVRTHAFGEMPYANFGVMRRELGERLDWWGDYYQYAGDTELSVKVKAAGYSVAPLDPRQGFIVHYELQDATRVPNIETLRFDEKWRKRNKRELEAEVRTAPVTVPAAPIPLPAVPPRPTRGTRAVAALPPTNAATVGAATVRMQYIGGRHGKVPYQKDAGRVYVVGAQHPEFWAAAADVEWLLRLRDHGRPLFRVVE